MIPLPPAQVHLWCCRTDLDEVETAARLTILSDTERARADRFRHDEARTAFVAARSWLRRILAGYTRVPAQRLRLDEMPLGKPFLAHPRSDPPIAFNLSHSGELAIVAVAAGMAIGVDIERIRPVPADVVAGCLAPGEAASLAAMPSRLREEAFIRGWTRKEAYLKATGIGLDVPLSTVSVSLEPSEARLLTVQSDPEEAPHWRLADLRPAPGYCGALAARRHGWSAVWMARPGSVPAAESSRFNLSRGAPPR